MLFILYSSKGLFSRDLFFLKKINLLNIKKEKKVPRYPFFATYFAMMLGGYTLFSLEFLVSQKINSNYY